MKSESSNRNTTPSSEATREDKKVRVLTLRARLRQELEEHWRFQRQEQAILEGLEIEQEEGLRIMLDWKWRMEKEIWIEEIMKDSETWTDRHLNEAVKNLIERNREEYVYDPNAHDNKEDGSAIKTQEDQKDLNEILSVELENVYKSKWIRKMALRIQKRKQSGILKMLPSPDLNMNPESWILWTDWLIKWESRDYSIMRGLFGVGGESREKNEARTRAKIKRIQKTRRWKRLKKEVQKKIEAEIWQIELHDWVRCNEWSSIMAEERLKEWETGGGRWGESEVACQWFESIRKWEKSGYDREMRKKRNQCTTMIKRGPSRGVISNERLRSKNIERVFHYGTLNPGREFIVDWIRGGGGMELWSWVGKEYYQDCKKRGDRIKKNGQPLPESENSWAWPLSLEKPIRQFMNGIMPRSEVDWEVNKTIKECIKLIWEGWSEGWSTQSWGEVLNETRGGMIRQEEQEKGVTLDEGMTKRWIMKGLWTKPFKEWIEDETWMMGAKEYFNKEIETWSKEGKNSLWMACKTYRWGESKEFWDYLNERGSLWGIQKREWMESWIRGVYENLEGENRVDVGWNMGAIKTIERWRDSWFKNQEEMEHWIDSVDPKERELWCEIKCRWGNHTWAWNRNRFEGDFKKLKQIESKIEDWYEEFLMNGNQAQEEGKKAIQDEMFMQAGQWKKAWTEWLESVQKEGETEIEFKLRNREEAIRAGNEVQRVLKMMESDYVEKRKNEALLDRWMLRVSTNKEQKSLGIIRQDLMKKKDVGEKEIDWKQLNWPLNWGPEDRLKYLAVSAEAKKYEWIESWIIKKYYGEDELSPERWKEWIKSRSRLEIEAMEWGMNEASKIVETGVALWGVADAWLESWLEWRALNALEGQKDQKENEKKNTKRL